MTPLATFLTIGHVTTDVIDGAEVCGGAALYSAVQARALGCDVSVFTSAPAGHAALALLLARGAKVFSLPSPHATTFVYAQVRGERRGALTTTAAPLLPDALPAALAAADVVLLSPVFREIPLDFLERAALRARIVGVAPQGWMRRRGKENVVERAPCDLPRALLERTSALFLSECDSDDADALAQRAVAQGAGVAIVTRGAAGATLFSATSRLDVPAASAREVDPTGAGDVFATAFLVATHEGAAAVDAAHFAAAAAACSVEGTSVSAIAERPSIARRSLA